MKTMFFALIRVLRLCLRSRAPLQAENIALRHQITVLQRNRKRLRLNSGDRFFLLGLAVPPLDRLAVGTGNRQSGNSYPLASQRILSLLGLEKQRCAGRAPGDSSGSAGSDPKDESGELPLGSAQNPR